MVGIRTRSEAPTVLELAAKLAVIELAVAALGALALRGPRARLSTDDRVQLNQALFDALEVLNDEKEDDHGSS